MVWVLFHRMPFDGLHEGVYAVGEGVRVCFSCIVLSCSTYCTAAIGHCDARLQRIRWHYKRCY